MRGNNILLNKIPSEMSDKERDYLLEQYKLYVGLMDKISERRDKANSFFLTVNTFLITAQTGLISFTSQLINNRFWIIFGSLAGIIFCLTWRTSINSYKQLNKGKFEIIKLLEIYMPARVFAAEWEILNHGDGSVYIPFTKTEKNVPLIFISLYFILIIFTVLTEFYKM